MIDGYTPTIELISTSNGQTVHMLRGTSTVPHRIRFSPNSKVVMAVGDDNRLVAWDTESGKEIARFHSDHADFGPLAFTSDGKSFIAGTSSGYIGCFSLQDGTPQFAIPFRVRKERELFPEPPFNATGVLSVKSPSAGRSLYLLLRTSKKWPDRTEWSRIQKWEIPESSGNSDSQ